jgi:hypothetical protein
LLPLGFESPVEGISIVVEAVFTPTVSEIPVVDAGVVNEEVFSLPVFEIPVEGSEEDLFTGCRLGLASFE